MSVEPASHDHGPPLPPWLLQLPVAGVGLLVLGGAIQTAATIPSAPPGSDGFLEGLAFLFMIALGYAGFVVFALGLTIPPMGGLGIHFSRTQRLLFGVGAALTLAGLVLPVVGFGILFGAAMAGDGTPLLLLWLFPTVLGVLSVTVGLLWRLGEVVVPRVRQSVLES